MNEVLVNEVSVPMNELWMERGNCLKESLDTFFPNDGVGVTKARKICQSCGVQETCLNYALNNKIKYGVWGGCSERQRRRLMRDFTHSTAA